MIVGELCNREVVISPANSTITECAQLMREHHVGCIVIVKSDADVNTPIGILTDRDIVVELIARKSTTDEVTASDLIIGELITAREVDSLWETMVRMKNKGVRRIPVINDENVLIIYNTNIAEEFLKEFQRVQAEAESSPLTGPTPRWTPPPEVVPTPTS